MSGAPDPVLVVDDEDLVRNATVKLMRRMGFGVEAQPSGADAIRAVRERAFAMVLLDMTMPGMDGIATFRQIRAQRPDLPVVFMSGDEHLLEEVRTEPKVELLLKPFSMDSVREIIEGLRARGHL